MGVKRTEDIRVRRCLPSDAPDCARLVLASAERFFPAVFGPRIGDALERLSAGRGTLFSHEHALVAEAAGSTAGILVGYTGAQKQAEDPRTGLGLLRLLGWDFLKRLGRLLSLQRTIGSLGRVEYSVSNVAVYPGHRGRGIGGILLARAEQEASRAGCYSLVLDVETDNEGAIRLYERLGFATRTRTAPLVLDGRAFSFHRMGKPVVSLLR